MRIAHSRRPLPASLSPILLTLTLTFTVGLAALPHTTRIGAQPTIEVNTTRVGFLNLVGGKNPVGVTGYRTGGRRYALVCQFDDGLRIVDTTDPTAPRIVATVPGLYRRVATYQQYAITTADNGVTAIVDLTDPTRPAIAGTIPIGAHTLAVDGNRLYLNRFARGMLVYDLQANPTSPVAIGRITRDVHACTPSGNTLYVHGAQPPNTQVFDTTEPAQPISIGSLSVGKHSSELYTAPDGRKILCTCDDFAGGHLQLWDITTLANPTRVGRYQTDPAAAIHDIDVRGAYVFVCYYKDQFRVVDISDVTQPREVGVWDNNPANAGGLHADMFQTYPYHDAVYMTQMHPTPGGPTRGVHLLDFFPGFGTGAPGTANAIPEIRWSFGPPSPGNSEFALRLLNARPGAIALLALGASRSRWGARPLPTALTDFGAANVLLHVSPDILLLTGVGSNGTARFALPVPNGVGFQRLYAQWIVLDIGAPNAGKIAATRAGELIVY